MPEKDTYRRFEIHSTCPDRRAARRVCGGAGQSAPGVGWAGPRPVSRRGVGWAGPRPVRRSVHSMGRRRAGPPIPRSNGPPAAVKVRGFNRPAAGRGLHRSAFRAAAAGAGPGAAAAGCASDDGQLAAVGEMGACLMRLCQPPRKSSCSVRCRHSQV